MLEGGFVFGLILIYVPLRLSVLRDGKACFCPLAMLECPAACVYPVVHILFANQTICFNDLHLPFFSKPLINYITFPSTCSTTNM